MKERQKSSRLNHKLQMIINNVPFLGTNICTSGKYYISQICTINGYPTTLESARKGENINGR